MLLASGLCLVTVVLDVRLCCLRGMMRRVKVVTMSRVRMMGRRLVVTGFVMTRGLAMVASCVVMMLCCLVVMLCCFFGHASSLEDWVGLGYAKLTVRC